MFKASGTTRTARNGRFERILQKYKKTETNTKELEGAIVSEITKLSKRKDATYSEINDLIARVTLKRGDCERIRVERGTMEVDVPYSNMYHDQPVFALNQSVTSYLGETEYYETPSRRRNRLKELGF